MTTLHIPHQFSFNLSFGLLSSIPAFLSNTSILLSSSSFLLSHFVHCYGGEGGLCISVKTTQSGISCSARAAYCYAYSFMYIYICIVLEL